MLRPRAYVIAVAQTTSAAEGFGDGLGNVGDFSGVAVRASTFTRHRQPLTSANLVTAVCGTRTGRLAGQSRAPGIGYRGKMTNPAQVILRTEKQILRVQRRIWLLQTVFWIAAGAAVLAAAATLVRKRRPLAPPVQPQPRPNTGSDTTLTDKPTH